ncbi:MAG: hypothetical protein AAB037_01640 [Chloroflexota bacterium]
METTEKIVEAYVRYMKHCATIPNIKCEGQFEIDLLAINPQTLERYHIESGVSISGGFSALTGNLFDPKELKQRVHQASQRRTLGYFRDRKFASPEVSKKLNEYGFTPGNYTKIVVSWGWDEEAKKQADEASITLWDFRNLLREIAKITGAARTYFTDDTLRTLQLMAKAGGSTF